MIGLIVGAISWLVGAVADAAVSIAAALAAVWAVVGPILAAIWSALVAVWSNVLKPVWGLLREWGVEVYKVYQKYVDPIVTKIQGITKLLRRVYSTFIAPVRDLLSILEQFLTLTHLNQTALGRLLDAEFHRIDTAIGQVWAELTKPINAVLKIINEVILDAKGLLQAPLLLESTAHYMGTILDQWWASWQTSITTDWGAYLNGWKHPLTPAPGIAAGHDYLQGKPSYLAPHVDRAVLTFGRVAAGQEDQILTADLDPGPGGLT